MKGKWQGSPTRSLTRHHFGRRFVRHAGGRQAEILKETRKHSTTVLGDLSDLWWKRTQTET